MAETKAAKQRAPRRRWALAEKRRIVELTFHAGASVAAIAREQGVNQNNLRQWQLHYRAGKFDAQATTSRAAGLATNRTFLPVNMVQSVRRAPSATGSQLQIRENCVVQLVLASGATLRIETVRSTRLWSALSLQSCRRRFKVNPPTPFEDEPTSEPGRSLGSSADPSPRSWLATTPHQLFKEGSASNVRSVGWTFICCAGKA